MSDTSNRQKMQNLIDQWRALEARPIAISEKKREQTHAKGQLTARERLAHLLDPGMPFLQLHAMAGYLVDTDDPDTSVPGSSVILGIGYVGGTRVMVWVDDAGIKAGAMGAMTVPAILSAQNIALRQKLPLIHLVQSAGANLTQYKVEDWAFGGKVFYNLARLSQAGIPTIAVLHGAATAGGAYMPGMSDYVIGVRAKGMAALAGAALVQSATGEIAKDADLGGAEMHAQKSGLVEYLAENDAHAIDIARDVIVGLDWHNASDTEGTMPPALSSEDLLDIVPIDAATPFDMAEVAKRIVDGSILRAFKPDYGVSMLCLQARLYGKAVGIVANNGPIDTDGATKAAQFIQLCGQAGTPLIFLNNTTGFMVGTAYEQAGMIKHGSKLIQAVSTVDVPRVTIYIGASFGAGNYGMSGFAYEPDFLFSWPNSTSGVMGGAQAAGTMDLVARGAAKRIGQEVDEERLAAQQSALTTHFDRQHSAFYTSGRCLDHGIIDPRDTRRVIGLCLDICRSARKVAPNKTSYGVSRF